MSSVEPETFQFNKKYLISLYIHYMSRVKSRVNQMKYILQFFFLNVMVHLIMG